MNDPSVNRCCASCLYKKLTRTTQRYCQLKNEKVSPHDVCDHWQISRLLKSILRQ